jgi:hypothetical protein
VYIDTIAFIFSHRFPGFSQDECNTSLTFSKIAVHHIAFILLSIIKFLDKAKLFNLAKWSHGLTEVVKQHSGNLIQQYFFNNF